MPAILPSSEGDGDEDRTPKRSHHERRADSELVGLREGGGESELKRSFNYAFATSYVQSHFG